MSAEIVASFNQIQGREVPGVLSAQTANFGQSNGFFQLAVAKNNRTVQLKEHFSKIGIKRLILSANINGFDCRVPDCTVEYLEKDFFSITDDTSTAAKLSRLENSVVIVNNNDVGRHMDGYALFYSSCPRTVFVAWDWDNHHWLDLSTFLAAHSDLYAPAHLENLYLLTRYNWATIAPIHCSTVQWSRKQLSDELPNMITTIRSNSPLGMHIPYAAFSFRNQVVCTLNRTYPSVGFSDHSFHTRMSTDRLNEWISHKAHWISPVLNDYGIRIADALCTGGIPLVPESMAYLPGIREIPRSYVLAYTPHDILEPTDIVEKAIALFDQGGSDKIVERHRYGIEKCHGENYMCKIYDSVKARYAP